MESGYGDAVDSDDTNSECSDGDDLRQFVPALRNNAIENVHCVQHAIEKYAGRDAQRERGHSSPGAGACRPRPRRRRAMTKYEYARLRSMRIAQLANGSPPLVQSVPARHETRGVGPELDMLERVFEEEVHLKRLPYIIRRSYADGRVDYIRASQLDCDRWLTNDA